MNLDSLKEKIPGCEFFTWKEALWVPKWEIYALPQDFYVIENIKQVAKKIDKIRSFIGQRVIITSWYRPKRYNDLINGAKNSKHILGMAVDFTCVDISAQDLRSILYPKLTELNIRMENLPTANWVHIDISCDEKMDLKQRYFKP